AVLMGLGIAHAQLASTALSSAPALSGEESNSRNYSRSSDFALAHENLADPGASAVPAAGGGQRDNSGGGGGRHYAWVGGGGFNAPIGNDTPYITWGGNFTAGGG